MKTMVSPRSVSVQEPVMQRILDSAKVQDWQKVVELSLELLEKGSHNKKVLELYCSAQMVLGSHKLLLLKLLDWLERGFLEGSCMQYLKAVVPKLTAYDRAVLNKLAKAEVPDKEVLYFTALLAMRMGDEAELYVRQNPSIFLADAAKLCWVVDCMNKQHLYFNVERLLREYCLRWPDSTKLWCRLVYVGFLQTGDDVFYKVDEFYALAKRLYRDFPEDDEVLLGIGHAHHYKSEAEKAVMLMEGVFKKRPELLTRETLVFDSAYIETLTDADFLKIRRDWAECLYRNMPSIPAFKFQGQPVLGKVLRIGYLSADFGRHPVGYFLRGILKHHSAQVVELYLYSHRDPIGKVDWLTKEFMSQAEGCGHWHWRTVWGLSTAELVRQIREDKIDILVDLGGLSKEHRADAIMARCAPVQVHWLGFAGTTGIRNMDYRISDGIIEPEGDADRVSSEKIWRLPHGFHALQIPENAVEVAPSPILKNGYLTFGSYNNIIKIGTRTVELWSQLLRAIPDSVLILKHRSMQDFHSREGLRSQFVMHGVDGQRIRFRGLTAERSDHFKHYGSIDIALDPYGYNGTTTTCEALFMGVPVLTLPGKTHASRVSASLLHRMGMDAWVAGDEAQYVRICQAARSKPEALDRRRQSMRQAYLNSPLGDGAAMARDLEVAYCSMWKRYCEESTTAPNKLIKTDHE